MYDKSANTIYYTQLASVYIINPDEMIQVKTIEDLKKVGTVRFGQYILKNDIGLSGIDGYR